MNVGIGALQNDLALATRQHRIRQYENVLCVGREVFRRVSYGYWGIFVAASQKANSAMAVAITGQKHLMSEKTGAGFTGSAQSPMSVASANG